MTRRPRGRPPKQPSDWLRDNDEMLSWVENELTPPSSKSIFRPAKEERFSWVLGQLELTLAAQNDPAAFFKKLKSDWIRHRSGQAHPHTSVSISQAAYETLKTLAKKQGKTIKQAASDLILEDRKTRQEIEAAKREAKQELKQQLQQNKAKQPKATLGKAQVDQYEPRIKDLEQRLSEAKAVASALQETQDALTANLEQAKQLISALSTPPAQPTPESSEPDQQTSTPPDDDTTEHAVDNQDKGRTEATSAPEAPPPQPKDVMDLIKSMSSKKDDD